MILISKMINNIYVNILLVVLKISSSSGFPKQEYAINRKSLIEHEIWIAKNKFLVPSYEGEDQGRFLVLNKPADVNKFNLYYSSGAFQDLTTF